MGSLRTLRTFVCGGNDANTRAQTANNALDEGGKKKEDLMSIPYEDPSAIQPCHILFSNKRMLATGLNTNSGLPSDTKTKKQKKNRIVANVEK